MFRLDSPNKRPELYKTILKLNKRKISVKSSVVCFWQRSKTVMQRTCFGMLSLMWILTGVPAAMAAEPTLVQDINTLPPSWRPSVSAFAAHHGKVFFIAEASHYDEENITENHGYSLWKSDGTDKGTVLVKEFTQEPCFRSRDCKMVSAYGKLWIGGTSGLWVSDGTAAGTRELVRLSLPEVDIWNCEDNVELTAAAGRMFFIGITNEHGYEVWSSDGTSEGTAIVKDLASNDIPYMWDDAGSWVTECEEDIFELEAANDKVFIAAQDGLWVTDGTDSGTLKLKNDNFDSSIPMVATSTGSLFFAADYNELWETDGTIAGTKQIALPSTMSIYGNGYFTSVGDAIYFIGYGSVNGESKAVLVKVDAITGRASTIKAASLTPAYLKSFNGELFVWSSSTTNDYELWKSDGTNAGTVFIAPTPLPNLPTEQGEIISTDANLFYLVHTYLEDSKASIVLWKSDGTANGTTSIKRVFLGPDYKVHGELTAVNDKVLFAINSNLWTSNGTPFGTRQVNVPVLKTASAIDPAPYYRASLADMNGALYFLANDGVHGRELWKRDPVNGVRMVRDIASGAASSIQDLKEAVTINGTLYFAANDGIHGWELWKSDGTAVGTVMVRDIVLGASSGYPGHLTNVNGTLYFSAQTPSSGRELWRSNGTAGGTVMVKNIGPGKASGFVDNSRYVLETTTASRGSEIYFSADDGVHGPELWKSNGTAAGTVLVQDIRKGGYSSAPSDFFTVNGTVFFTAYQKDSGRELWKTNGTAAGTALVKDILPGGQGSDIGSFTAHNGILYFIPRANGARPQLWRSNGTTTGTYAVKDFSAIPGGHAQPYTIKRMGGALFVGAIHKIAENSSTALWKSDGTSSGTVLFHQFPANQYPYLYDAATSLREAVMLDGMIYLPNFDPIHGERLWQTDGTDAGTKPLSTPLPGRRGISPANLTVSGDALFFVGDDEHGYELWTYAP